MGGLDVKKVVKGDEGWRLLSCNWLHGGVVHLLMNMKLHHLPLNYTGKPTSPATVTAFGFSISLPQKIFSSFVFREFPNVARASSSSLRLHRRSHRRRA